VVSTSGFVGSGGGALMGWGSSADFQLCFVSQFLMVWSSLA